MPSGGVGASRRSTRCQLSIMQPAGGRGSCRDARFESLAQDHLNFLGSPDDWLCLQQASTVLSLIGPQGCSLAISHIWHGALDSTAHVSKYCARTSGATARRGGQVLAVCHPLFSSGVTLPWQLTSSCIEHNFWPSHWRVPPPLGNSGHHPRSSPDSHAESELQAFWLAGALAQSRRPAIRPRPCVRPVPLPRSTGSPPVVLLAAAPPTLPSPILRQQRRGPDLSQSISLPLSAPPFLFLPASHHQHTALPFFHPSRPVSPSSVREVVVLAVGAVIAARHRHLIEQRGNKPTPSHSLGRYTKIHSKKGSGRLAPKHFNPCILFAQSTFQRLCPCWPASSGLIAFVAHWTRHTSNSQHR